MVADETEKGWYIQWIDRDPRLLAMQEAAAKREKADLDDEEKQVRSVIQWKKGRLTLHKHFRRRIVRGGDADNCTFQLLRLSL